MKLFNPHQWPRVLATIIIGVIIGLACYKIMGLSRPVKSFLFFPIPLLQTLGFSIGMSEDNVNIFSLIVGLPCLVWFWAFLWALIRSGLRFTLDRLAGRSATAHQPPQKDV